MSIYLGTHLVDPYGGTVQIPAPKSIKKEEPDDKQQNKENK